MKRDPHSYQPRERAALIATIEAAAANGKSVILAAKELGITAAIYYRWLRERAVGAQPASPHAQERSVPERGYPEQRKRELVAEIRQLVAQGRTIEAAARALGISGTTYHQWVRAGITPVPLPEPAAPPMRPVELVTALVPVSQTVTMASPPDPVALTLIAPGGYRVEGLDVPGTAALLRALA